MRERLLIIVLTYNRVNWLEECLQSFLSQTYQDFRIVVLDNASDQDIEGMIHKLKDSRISLFRNETNLGVLGNYKKAWEMVDSDFFMIFHDDDCVHPRMLESQMQVFKEVPNAAFVMTGCEIIRDHTKMKAFDLDNALFYEVFEDDRALARAYIAGRKPFGFCSTLYRTSILMGTQSILENLTERFSLCFDKSLLLSLAQKGPCAYLTSPTYNTRQHKSQDSLRLATEVRYTREVLRFYREMLDGAWDPITVKYFERTATLNLITTYSAWLRRNPVNLTAVLKDIATQDIIRPLTFLRCSVKVAMKYIYKHVYRLAKRFYLLFCSFFFNPMELINKCRALPYFTRNLLRYLRLNRDRSFRFRLSEVLYTSHDRFASAGTARGHYFWQDLWAARYLFDHHVGEHVDVGSRLDGFLAHIVLFCRVIYVDIRPIGTQIPGLEERGGSILQMPFDDNSLSSLSCLHVIEHIGLGRYGDSVDPDSYLIAASELVRVLRPGGVLLLGVPVGRERLCFDAHRIFDPQTIVKAFSPLRLEEFSLIDDEGKGIICNASFNTARRCNYGCGLFVFKK